MIALDEAAGLHVRAGGRHETLPLVGPYHVRAPGLVVPVELAFAQSEYSPQNEAEDALRMGLGVGQRQGGPPGAAEDEPALHTQVFAQPLHVRHEMPGCVHPQVGLRFRGVGPRAPASALIEQDDAVPLRIEDPAMVRAAGAPGPAVDEDRRDPLGTAAGLPVHALSFPDIEQARGRRFDRRVRDAQLLGAGERRRGGRWG